MYESDSKMNIQFKFLGFQFIFHQYKYKVTSLLALLNLHGAPKERGAPGRE
jgi:hypothetical protein